MGVGRERCSDSRGSRWFLTAVAYPPLALAVLETHQDFKPKLKKED